MLDCKAKMHKIQFRSAPDPARELTALPHLLAELKAATSKGGGGEEE